MRPAMLTVREKEIVQLVARGYSNKAIAASLSIAPQTVKNHLHTIFLKLEVTSRLALALRELERP